MTGEEASMEAADEVLIEHEETQKATGLRESAKKQFQTKKWPEKQSYKKLQEVL